MDILTSGLVAARDTAWVFGDLKHDDGRYWLLTGGNTNLVFEVPAAFVADKALGEQLWFAEVECRPPGVPVGPVRKLEALASHDDVWTRWAARVSDG